MVGQYAIHKRNFSFLAFEHSLVLTQCTSNRFFAGKLVVAEVVSRHVVRQLMDFASWLFMVLILGQVSFTLNTQVNNMTLSVLIIV